MKTLSDHFKKIAIEPDPLFEERLGESLRLAEVQATRRVRTLSLLGISLSLGSALFGVFEYGNALWQSPFWSLLTLLSTDLGLIVSALPDFTYSLLETLPIVPLLFLFAPLTLFFWSLSFWTKIAERSGRPLIHVERIS
jgi:hypothetical protein